MGKIVFMVFVCVFKIYIIRKTKGGSTCHVLDLNHILSSNEDMKDVVCIATHKKNLLKQMNSSYLSDLTAVVLVSKYLQDEGLHTIILL